MGLQPDLLVEAQVGGSVELSQPPVVRRVLRLCRLALPLQRVLKVLRGPCLGGATAAE